MGNALAARTAAQPLLSGQALRVLTDEKLAAMVAAGSDDAFGTLYRRYHQPIYRYCVSLLGQEADARDALQTSMLAALSSLRSRPIEGAFKPWLFRIAHNESISIIRARGREAPSEAPSAVAVSDDPETREQLRTLVADLGALPDRQRGAIVMRELNGLSYAEIGAALGTSAAAGKQLVYEARTALHDLRAGHEMSCQLVRERISARDRRLLRGRKVRSHLRGCQPCQDFEQAIDRRRGAFVLLAPPLSPLVAAAVLKDVFTGGGASGGAGGAGGAAGATGAASGGFSSMAVPAALKVAAAVVLTGAAGVGAYKAGSAVFSGETASSQAAVTDHHAPAGRAAHDGAPGKSGHAAKAAPAHRNRHGGAPTDPVAKHQASARGADQGAGGETSQATDPVTGTSAAPDPATTSAPDTSTPPSSDPGGVGGGDPSGGGGAGGGGAGGGGAGGGGGGGGGGDGGPPPPDPDTGPPTTGPPPPQGGQLPPATPPGHGGVPPGHGGVPPGQAGGDVPPGLINNPGHGGGK